MITPRRHDRHVVVCPQGAHGRRPAAADILVIDSSFNDKKYKDKTIKKMFEKPKTQLVLVMNSSVLSLFSVGATMYARGYSATWLPRSATAAPPKDTGSGSMSYSDIIQEDILIVCTAGIPLNLQYEMGFGFPSSF